MYLVTRVTRYENFIIHYQLTVSFTSSYLYCIFNPNNTNTNNCIYLHSFMHLVTRVARYGNFII